MSTELTAPTKIEADPIGTALIAAGVTTASIEQLAKDYGELARMTDPIQSSEEYEIVKRAQLACRDIRTAVTAALKIERDEAVRYQKFVIQEEKRILAQIATTEEPLKKLREDYDNRILLAQQEEARQWVEKMNLRKQAAFDIGYYFNGQAYLLDRENGEAPWVLREDQVAGMAMSDEALYALLEAQAAELKMTREIKAEAEAKAEDERKAQAAEQKRKDEEAAQKMAEIERREKEMQAREVAMNAQVNEGRRDELVTLGAKQYEYAGENWIGSDEKDSLNYRESILSDLNEAEWSEIKVRVRDAKAKAIEEQRERERKTANYAQRSETLCSLGFAADLAGSFALDADRFTNNELGGFNEEEWAVVLARFKEAARRLYEEAEAHRQQQEKERIDREEQIKADAAERAVAEERERAKREREAKEKAQKLLEEQERERDLQASDREKVIAFAVKVVSVKGQIPTLESAIGTSAMKAYYKQLDELVRSLETLSKEL